MANKLSDTFLLPRAGKYQNALNSNARLPFIYGNLEDGNAGNWICPNISSVTFVYSYAGHEVMSSSSGNDIAVYSGSSLMNAADYTFSHSNDFESLGNIATITFDNDQQNNVIAASGRGILNSSATPEMKNIIDIADDFLTSKNALDFSYDLTSKQLTSNTFDSQGYVAAGVISQDGVIWDILQKMVGSFLGSAYLASDTAFFSEKRKLKFEMEIGTSTTKTADVIPKADITFLQGTQRRKSLINQCPISFSYNYVDSGFRSHNDGTNNINSASSNIYGIQEPSTPYQLHWCRDSASGTTIQNVITGKYGKPVWEIEWIDASLERIAIDAGDFIAGTFDWLYNIEGIPLINQVVKILSLSPDFIKNVIKFRGIDTGSFLIDTSTYYLADGTYLADGGILAGTLDSENRDLTEY